MMIRTFSLGVLLLLAPLNALAQVSLDLPNLLPKNTETQNGLWGENPPNRCYQNKKAVIAEIKGPAMITMIHFALPMSLKCNRDVMLRIYWDDEKEPSVDCPLVDFYCDPAGTQEDLYTVLVNKRRGWNAYFPMPFRKSARVEIVNDSKKPWSNEMWAKMPAYSYVMYQNLDSVPENAGYFHTYWHQESLLLGEKEYPVMEAKGQGKFIGWNITIRIPGNSKKPGLGGYPVDENEKFYIDGEKEPSVEFQGLEDAFGFSWAFPETQSLYPVSGYFPFFKGASCYKFLLSDAVYFQKSLRVSIGFGKIEGAYNKEYSDPKKRLQISTTSYWYQTEPHMPWPAMPLAEERAPAPDEPSWLDEQAEKEAKASGENKEVKQPTAEAKDEKKEAK